MKDFIFAALPWVIMGLCLACLAANIAGGKRKRAGDTEKKDETYMVEGMCLGMCAGVVFSMLGISLGMLIGMAVGSFIHKNNK